MNRAAGIIHMLVNKKMGGCVFSRALVIICQGYCIKVERLIQPPQGPGIKSNPVQLTPELMAPFN